jgi:hypothetical protein
MGIHHFGINYLEPVPGASLVRPENNIIIGFENQIVLNQGEISSSITVSGSKSGQHNGTVILCSGNKKIIFNPTVPFETGETINVRISGRLLCFISNELNEYSYSFNTVKKFPSNTYSLQIQNQNNPNCDQISSPNPILKNLPPGLPHLTIITNTDPADGYLFLAPHHFSTYLTITDKNGNPYWYSMISNSLSGDFKKQPNGNLTYYNGVQRKFYETDQNYHIIDSFYCGNGYHIDLHELRLLSNGHALVMAYDSEIVDMSRIVQGGDTAAMVIGLIIQELDENKNVVFQWRSWDHFAITDALHECMLSSYIDAVHGNAIEEDNDGNLMISSRHLDEITKISRTTGEIIWRFGGLHNQFTFIGDTLKFNYQHAIRRVSNGHITLYDNGNFHHPLYSRAVEYALDEVNKTATVVWQFRHNPDVFGSWGGYVQRLEGGNTLIGWGGANPAITEVQPNGTIVFEASYPLGVDTYRVYKLDWNGPPIFVNNQSSTFPKTYKLNQNYPNPFNPTTTIEFELPRAGTINLKIYDITGREAESVIDNVHLDAGAYKYSFEGISLSSGVYFYQLIADGLTISSKKMVLIK